MIARVPWIVTYDITDDRMRKRMIRELSRMGQRIQKSVFLCHMLPTELAQLQQLPTQLALTGQDRLHAFVVTRCMQWQNDTQDLGLQVTQRPTLYLGE